MKFGRESYLQSKGHEVGLLIYATVIHDMQQVDTVAASLIDGAMSKLHIYDIIGEDVKVLKSTLFEYCRRLEGLAFDLAGIVAACFLKLATMGFNMEMQTIYKQVIANNIKL